MEIEKGLNHWLRPLKNLKIILKISENF